MRLSDSNQSLPCSRPHPQVGWTSARVNCTENNVLVVTPGKCVGGRYINFPAGEYETGFSNFDSYHTNIYDTNECVACPAGRWGDQTNADRWVCVYACACVRARTCACVCAHMRVCVCLTGKNTLTVDAKFACPAASPWTWGGPWSVCPSAPRGSTATPAAVTVWSVVPGPTPPRRGRVCAPRRHQGTTLASAPVPSRSCPVSFQRPHQRYTPRDALKYVTTK